MSFALANTLGKRREPFLLISDFTGKKVDVFPLEKLKEENIQFSIDEKFSYTKHKHHIKVFPIPFDTYKMKFEKVIEKIRSGDTYVLNLTQATKIDTDLELKDIYKITNAHYKLFYKDKFVCFSPEKFIQIENEIIHTFPMKGTVDASLKNAEVSILENEKEMAEHVMIVDLLRNDLSIVARDVKVEKFRYITKLCAGKKNLLQVSSHISGNVGSNWHESVGDILSAILPAGSISGAPKKSTLKIIEEVEEYERGYFSGIFAYYDGNSLDSGVMIRFIEKTKEGLFYKSGGGITLDSNAFLEYNELQDKIYLP